MLMPTDSPRSGFMTIGGHYKIRKRLSIVLLTGISLFAFLYILAAVTYPGGSNTHPNEPGFNLLTNYWCDLLGGHAKNGQLNSAQPIAFVAMAVLCLTLACFWYVTPLLFGFSHVGKCCLQGMGVLSMSVAPFIFTAYHDTVINVAGVLGVFALAGTLIGLYRNQFFRLFGVGLFGLFLCGLNYSIYQTGQFIEYLPVIQKITFFVFLLWFSFIGLTLHRNTIVHAQTPYS